MLARGCEHVSVCFQPIVDAPLGRYVIGTWFVMFFVALCGGLGFISAECDDSTIACAVLTGCVSGIVVTGYRCEGGDTRRGVEVGAIMGNHEGSGDGGRSAGGGGGGGGGGWEMGGAAACLDSWVDEFRILRPDWHWIGTGLAPRTYYTCARLVLR